jgi:hypothetical protein
MGTPSRRARLPILLWTLLAVACGSAKHTERASRPESATRAVEQPVPRPAAGLYTADEALRDALSGPWEYVGTGKWPGNDRMHACAFRNGRVLLVNGYCTITEQQAFRIDVYAPARGRVRIYAETSGPVSAQTRQQYFTFTAESEPPPGRETRISPLSLSMSFDELRAYEAQRYDAFLPACFGGIENTRNRTGCLGALEPRVREFESRNSSFLARASDDWYRVVRDMRALALQYGREPDK